MNRKQKIGRWGEAVALDYLLSKGYRFLDRNVHTPYGELDLILLDDEIVVFVEVKTRSAQTFGKPEISINQRKTEHILNSALTYLQDHPELGMNWRVDVLSIECDPESHNHGITWFENAIQ